MIPWGYVAASGSTLRILLRGNVGQIVSLMTWSTDACIMLLRLCFVKGIVDPRERVIRNIFLMIARSL